MKTFKEIDKGKKRKGGKSSAIEGMGGFFRIFLKRGDGDIFPYCSSIGVAPKDVSKCDGLFDLKELFIRMTSLLSHLLPADFIFRHADEETHIFTAEDFNRCLSETTITDPIQVIVEDKVFHGVKDAKRLRDRDTLIARYKQHTPSSMDPHTVKHIQCPSNGDGPLYRCDRPLADTLPRPLLHPVFGEFEDNLHNLCLQTRDDHAFVREFCDTSERFFKTEIDREDKIWVLLMQYLKRNITSPESTMLWVHK